MKLSLASISKETFLQEYWQQKPILIKGGFSDFSNPLEAEDLAGLAKESNIESRLISQRDDGSWHAESGPFEDYDGYGDSNWSLVVQSVNHWVPEVNDFSRQFDFIPQWQFDDVMVSFAAPGGGVGPHVDKYDVFICQGSGQRRWRVGDKNTPIKEVIAHEKLLHVEAFDSIIDEIVEAGDILYIPPGCPHEGVSIDQSMSFSVGYKTTNATELLSGFADYLIDFDAAPKLLNDAQRQLSCYGEISKPDADNLKSLLIDTLSQDERFADFLGIYLSQSRSELDLAEDEYEYDEWLETFKQEPLNKLYALKTLYTDEQAESGVFYVDGEAHTLATKSDTIRQICNSDSLCYSKSLEPSVLTWLWESTNRGYWYFSC